MPTNYEDVRVKCPFFISSSDKCITCEGITDDCTLTLEFRKNKMKKQYRRNNCEEDYEDCELYKTLERKYEE